MELRAEIASAIGLPAIDIEPMSGGCIGDVYLITLSDGQRLVAKSDGRGSTDLPLEGFMLRYLAENTKLPVPGVRTISQHLLLMEFMPGESGFTDAAERDAAEHLAELHAITAPAFGFQRDTLIGGIRQPNDQTGDWLSFFRDQRLLYIAAEATRLGRLPKQLAARVEKFAGRLDRWVAESRRPSLIHGDVWTTNVLADTGRITAFLDPAIYFADREIELAFILLFSTFGREFLDRYEELMPLESGFFEERRYVYSLYPLLVHVYLFGGAYVSSVDQTLRRFGF